MSRNGSGTYTIPISFTPSTLISATDMNSNFTDVASALTGSLATDGQAPMTGALRAYSGTVSLPGYSFASETSSGWYYAGSNDIRMAIGGAKVLQVTSAGLTVTGTLTATLAANSVAYAKIQQISADKRVLGNNSGAAGNVSELTASQVLGMIGTTQGSLLYCGSSSAWAALSPGTAGQYLQSQGAAANPQWGTPIPAMSGKAGYSLTTDGTSTSWTANTTTASVYVTGATGTPTLNGAVNIASVTKNGSGSYSVAFTATMANANYKVSVTPVAAGAAIYVAYVNTKSTTGFTMQTLVSGTGFVDIAGFDIMVVGGI